MYLFTNFVLFVLIWWMIFFISLPIRISVSNTPIPGHASSAPNKAYIGLKILITSAISICIMLVLMFINFDIGMFFKK